MEVEVMKISKWKFERALLFRIIRNNFQMSLSKTGKIGGQSKKRAASGCPDDEPGVEMQMPAAARERVSCEGCDMSYSAAQYDIHLRETSTTVEYVLKM